MNRQIVLISFLYLALLGCTGKAEIPKLEKGVAIITGHVKNLGENSKVIRFAAGGVVENIEQTAIIDSKGNFKLEIALYHPQNVQGFFKKGFMKLYIRPSDHIHLEIDEEIFKRENRPEFKISGTSPDAKISEEIQQYLRYCGKNSFHPDARGKSVAEFLKVLQEEMNRQDSIFERFSKEYNTSKEFENWAKKDMIYGVANYLPNYQFVHEDCEGDLFDKSIFPINDDAAIVTSLYPRHLMNYVSNIGMWQDIIISNLLEKNDLVGAYQRGLDKITNTVEKGLSRDIMCYKLLLSLCNESFEDYQIMDADLDKYLENETLKSVLLDKEREYQNRKEFDISFLDPKTNEEREISGNFWSELKAKYRGKIVYVDIWATWCGPCRAEIPHAIELHEYFKGQDIAFVNLCLASNENEWKEMIKKNNIKGDHYFFNNPQTLLLRNKLKFEGYPTYLIIDRQGNLVNKNAPRPSSKEKIRSLLKDRIKKDIPQQALNK